MNKTKRLAIFFAFPMLFAIALLVLISPAYGGNKNIELWKTTIESRVQFRGERTVVPEKYLVFRLNQTNLQNALSRIADEEILMEIPFPDGTTKQFRMRNAPVLSDELAADFPTWRNFAGEAVGDSSISGRFDWNVNGFHGYIFTPQGTVMIDPFQRNDKENYLVFYKHEFGAPTDEFYCNVNHKMSEIVKGDYPSMTPQPTEFTFGTTVRTYRLAIATTGEWARNAAGYDGSQSPTQIRATALGVVNTTVGRLNGIYLREISSQFVLVNPTFENNATNIIFDDPATDPYNNTDQADDMNGNVDQLRVNRETINARLGGMNYDIGHLYGTGGGGVATGSSLCDASKAEGYSARGTNTGDPFTVDYVAHELGHQFSASHTYNQVDPAGTCTTRSMTNAFEVASGSTIMSYVGICGDRNLQQYVDTGFSSFHIRSLTQMTTYLTDAGQPPTANNCGTTGAANNVPTVNAGAGFTIPALTPFTLTAAGNDADAGDVANLLYSWEEFDLSPSGSGTNGMPAGTYDVDTDGIQRSLFRAYSPIARNSRTFPSMNFILNPANNDPAGTNQPQLSYMGTHPTNAPGAVCQTEITCVVGERLPTISRTMNFRVSVRDRRGGIVDGGTTVTVAGGAGPFRVTAQDTLVEELAPNWMANTQQTVTWDVANTNAAPVNAANVNILLSTDGGLTFPITILANTPNDGTQQITVPNNPTTTARIKVEAVGNIFFDISNVNFTIIAAVAAQASISGRAVTSLGRGISGATVILTDQNGVSRRIRTSSFGYYYFDELEVGQNYTIIVSHKRYQFTPRVISVNEDLSGIDFIANE